MRLTTIVGVIHSPVDRLLLTDNPLRGRWTLSQEETSEKQSSTRNFIDNKRQDSGALRTLSICVYSRIRHIKDFDL